MMICEINNVPIPQKIFNVRPVSVIRPSLVTVIKGEEGIIQFWAMNISKTGLTLKFFCGIGTLFTSHLTKNMNKIFNNNPKMQWLFYELKIKLSHHG